MSDTQYVSQLELCQSRDRFPLQQKLRRARKAKDHTRYNKLLEALDASAQVTQDRLEQRPDIEYPDLPVSSQKEVIADAIANHQVVIIAGETGSGKTTQIPKICLELGRGCRGLIGHTQPRRLAARSVANRLASELNSTVGDTVGFKVRFTDDVSERTYVKLMTDGILLAELQRDRYLSHYDTIIIDEAHERSLNIDFILGYLKQLLPKRPDLKVIITSATIDPERFSNHFGEAPIIEVSGRTYPVDVRYQAIVDEEGQDQTDAIIDAVDSLRKEKPGDILVFLSGEREIRDTADALNRQQWRATEVLPLYARLSSAEQNRIFSPSQGLRRIVLATNVAETSLTVPGIKYVIDPGFARISRYSYRSKVQRLPIEPISQASANQRAGRCGRVSEGICIRLYSEDDFQSRPEFTDPEILRTNLASVILQMLAVGLGDIHGFPFVEPPEAKHIKDGFRLLHELGAIKPKGNGFERASLLQEGRHLARLPIDPRYGKMVLEAARKDCLNEILIITAGLSIQDPRERPQDKRQAADEAHREYHDAESDFVALYQLWMGFKEQQKALSSNQLRKWCRQHFINYLRMREWQDIVSQLKKSIAELGLGVNRQVADYDVIHQSIAAGLLSHIGFKDKDREYLGARNLKFMIFPGSGVAKKAPKWLMAAELTETSRLFARNVARIQPEWLEPLAGHLVKHHYSDPFWSKRQGAVMASERVTLYGLDIVRGRQVRFAKHDPQAARDIFIREALVNGQTKLDYAFLRDNQALVESLEEQEAKIRRRDILVDEEHLVDFYQQRLPQEVVGEAEFRRWWKAAGGNEDLNFDEALLRSDSASNIDEWAFPDTWAQGNLTLPLEYHFEPTDPDDGVSVLIPLGLLNQLDESGFDWHVPGLREELITTLIKSLPKRLRRNFVPAPDYASACVAAMNEDSGSFKDSLSHQLKRMTGVEVPTDEWSWQSLPVHLLINFKVLDDKQQVIDQDRDLLKLQQRLKGRVTEQLQDVATPEMEQDDLTRWDFGDLPTEFTRQQAGLEIKAYPALVDHKNTTAVRLFESAEKASQAHRAGVRRLLILQLPSPISYLQQKLPNKSKLGLYFNPFGRIEALIEDCIHAALDEMLDEHDDIRDEATFNRIAEQARGALNDAVLAIALKIEQGLTCAHGIHKRIKGNVPMTQLHAVGDIKVTLDDLVYPGFVTDVGADKLGDWQRYLQAVERRLDKLAVDPHRDRQHQITIERVTAQWQTLCDKQPKGKPTPSALKEVRWMIHELRVSLFAQQLGTAYPISAKRIQNVLQEF